MWLSIELATASAELIQMMKVHPDAGLGIGCPEGIQPPGVLPQARQFAEPVLIQIECCSSSVHSVKGDPSVLVFGDGRGVRIQQMIRGRSIDELVLPANA